jgi:2,4-dienoyl-CoA reductase-like NADH-dependent reductase (Old Yellow Enzyme family)
MTNAIASSSGKRIFLLGVNTGYVTDGLPDSRYIEFYRQRSSRALHCAIIGNVVVPGGYGSNDATPTLTGHPVWSSVAAAIAERGSMAGIQLATSWAGYVGTRKFVGSDPGSVIADARALVEELGPSGCAAMIDAFHEASDMAIDHGYRHVQLHGAHGYLLSLLIDYRINSRSEEILDSLSRLAERLAAAGIETSLRISLLTGDAAFDATGATRFHDSVAELPFDFIDLSSGFYNIDKRLIYPSRPDVIAARRSMTVNVASRHSDRKFILSGRAMNAAGEALPDNLHLGLCRDLIANPLFLAQPDRGCENRSKCHYFSKGETSLRCARWDDGESASIPLQGTA